MEEPNFTSSLPRLADTDINLCLAAAHAAMESGEYADADRLFKRGLKWTEERFGAQSAAVGLVLIAMIELYEKDSSGRSTEKLERRIGEICRRYFFQVLAERMVDED
jgi:hypothetical protein